MVHSGLVPGLYRIASILNNPIAGVCGLCSPVISRPLPATTAVVDAGDAQRVSGLASVNVTLSCSTDEEIPRCPRM